MNRIRRRLLYALEKFLLGGSFNLLIFIAILIVLISVAGGYLAHNYSTEKFESLFHAIWWAFLRLTDPGYLGDDNGTIKRVVSTTLTVLGYVLFMGALVAVMTQWLQSQIRRLEKGLTPLSMSGHFVILGWNDQTPSLVKDILTSGIRLKRFLKTFSAKNAKVVILTPEIDPSMASQIRFELGSFWNEQSVIFRSGSPCMIDDLQKVDPQRASAIFVPKQQIDEEIEENDDLQFKIAANLELLNVTQPQVIVEFSEEHNKESFQDCQTKSNITSICPNSISAHVIGTILQNPMSSFFFQKLFTKNIGPTVYIGSASSSDITFSQFQKGFDKALLLGVIRDNQVIFNPNSDFKLESQDLPILLAESLKETGYTSTKESEIENTSIPKASSGKNELGKIIFWGSNHSNKDHIAEELTQRSKKTMFVDGENATEEQLSKMKEVIQSKVTRVFVSTTENLVGPRSDSDVIGSLYQLKSFLIKNNLRVPVLANFSSPANLKIAENLDFEVISASAINSYFLSQIILKRELQSVFEAFFEQNRFMTLKAQKLEISFDKTWTRQELIQHVRSQGYVLIATQESSGEMFHVILEKDSFIITDKTQFLVLS